MTSLENIAEPWEQAAAGANDNSKNADTAYVAYPSCTVAASGVFFEVHPPIEAVPS